MVVGESASVAHPTIKYNDHYSWTKEETDLIEKMFPDPYVTVNEILEIIPWRTWNAINLKASRMGLKVKWVEP